MTCAVGEWKHLTLGEVAIADSGFAFKSADFQLDNSSEDSLPVVRMSDLKGGSLQIEGAARVRVDAVQKAEKFGLSADDFLFGMSGSLGNFAVVRASDLPAFLNQRVGRLRARDGNSQAFVTYLYLSDVCQAAIQEMATGAAQLNISIGDVRALVVQVPPLCEQQKIAAILTAVDDKLDVVARQISASKTLKQGLMQTLFSRGVGTQNSEGRWLPHTEFKDSDFGEIPQDWNLKTLGQVCEGALQTGPFGSQLHAAEYQDEGIPVLMPKDLINCRANLATAARISPLRAADLSKHTLVEGDLLFSRRGDVARFALIDKLSEGALCGTGCLKAKPSDAHSPAFLAHLLQLDVVRTWLEQNAVGQTMPNMNTSILSSLPLVVPTSKAEQEEIAGILNSLDAKASMLSDKQALYQTLKRGLMQKLLTGEWRVKLDSPTASV